MLGADAIAKHTGNNKCEMHDVGVRLNTGHISDTVNSFLPTPCGEHTRVHLMYLLYFLAFKSGKRANNCV